MLPRPGTGLSGYCPPGTGEAVPPRFRASAHTEKVGLVMRGWLSGLPGGGTARWGPEHPDGTLLIQPTLREHVGLPVSWVHMCPCHQHTRGDPRGLHATVWTQAGSLGVLPAELTTRGQEG